MAKSPVKLITFGFSESPVRVSGRKCSTWAAADAVLSEMARKGPSDGSYHKTDVQVEWENGATYGARVDVTSKPESLARHIREFAMFYSGRLADDKLPSHLTPEAYRDFQARQSAGSLRGYGQLLDEQDLDGDA